MKQLIARIYRLTVLSHPWTTLLMLALIQGFFSMHLGNFRLDASADSLLLEGDQDLKAFRQLSERYATREFLFVTFSPEQDLFSNASLQQVRRLRDQLRGLSIVESVQSLMDVPLVKQEEGSLSDVIKNWRTLEAPDAIPDRARKELLESPIFRNLIISADGQTTALQIFLKQDEAYQRLLKQRSQLYDQRVAQGLNAEQQETLKNVQAQYVEAKKSADQKVHNGIAEIRAVLDEYRPYGRLNLGGIPMVTDDMIAFIQNDLVVFGIGVFAFLILMLGVIFREVRWVILPLLSCVYAGLLMIGLLGLAGWNVTVISSNFISLMLIITMSMNVHLVVRYRQLVQEHPQWTQLELVEMTTRRMVWPCLYTALTTIIAFASLVVSGIKPVIDFGWMMTIGLCVAFLTTFILFPGLLMLMRRGQPVESSTDFQFTGVLAAVTERHGGKVLFLSLLLAVVSVYGVTRLVVENSFINYFDKKTEIYQGLKLIDEKLGGTTPLEIVLYLKEEQQAASIDADLDDLFGEIEGDKSDSWFTAYKIKRIKQVHDYLDSLPAVGKVLSLASLLRVGEDLNKGKPFDSFQLALVYKGMPAELRSSMIDPYISIEHDEARISLRIIDSLPDLRRKELLDKIQYDLEHELGIKPDEFKMTGMLVLYNNMLQSLFQSQIQTLGVVMLGITLMLLVLFRSVPLAVIGIIPNLLAAAIILGLMGLLDIPLDMMTITIAGITIGIAVDNSIHYIYRYREEFGRHTDDKQGYLDTLHYCHAHIGKAVFYTAVTIIVGFSILVMSNFIPTIYFGLLTALAMVIALFAALTLLPKLILVWRPF